MPRRKKRVDGTEVPTAPKKNVRVEVYRNDPENGGKVLINSAVARDTEAAGSWPKLRYFIKHPDFGGLAVILGDRTLEISPTEQANGVRELAESFG